MKSIAVIGAGPAGSTAAEQLARAGYRVHLLDEKLAWEKPCGGGVTYKAYQRYPYLQGNAARRREVVACELQATGVKPYRFTLNHPVLIYSRRDLNAMLIERAASAGAQVEKVRITAVERRPSGWRLKTPTSALEADFAIVATGARNVLRDFGTQWNSHNTMLAMGYYVPGKLESVVIRFFPWLQGYVWLFPRGDHISAGICGKRSDHRFLRKALEDYLDESGVAWRGAAFYAHLLPSLESTHWRGNRLAGEGWMAAGDAGGLVDPITGEGIYYAIRSGDLAARALADERIPTHAKAAAYAESIEQDFGADLELAAKICRLFYLGHAGIGTVPQRMIQFARGNAQIRNLLQDLMSGTQDYSGLRERLADSISARVFGMIVRLLRAGAATGEDPAPRARDGCRAAS
ncbi:MAG: NAD(P)/FAD-dependent oxidoreductase [Bryobacterales bacterium]|nr:NAD(P)/FAD-dependent oxidoreductase [Bryobacterales bacterium]